MSYIFEFKVVGSGTVKIYKNTVLVATSDASSPSKIINYEIGDVFMSEATPSADFIKSCDQLGTPCSTYATVGQLIDASWMFYRFVTYYFKDAIPPGVTINRITASQLNASDPQTITIKVEGIGDGIPFQIMEGNTVIATKQLINGMVLFNITGVSFGNHSYCTNPAAAQGCASVTVSPMKYGCVNDCSAPYVGGTFNTQPECITGCSNPGSGCSSISVDTWKPDKTVLTKGEVLNFVLRSKDPNKDFYLNWDSAIIGGAHTLIQGKTDSEGCYKGTIPAQPDGTYTIYICYPFFGLCTRSQIPVSPIMVRWGEEQLSTLQLVTIAVVFIAIVYLLQTYILSRNIK